MPDLGWDRAVFANSNNGRLYDKATGEGTAQKSVKILPDNTQYVEMETNLFTNKDGTPMTEREIFNSLVGTTIVFPDGMTATIEKRLPGNKEMYDELFKRRLATGEGKARDKQLNSLINRNFLDIAENAEGILYGEPDRDQRHLANNIVAFDTRMVPIYDGNYAYNLELSIATLSNGESVAYAKRDIGRNTVLENKIKQQAGTAGESPENQPVAGEAFKDHPQSGSNYTPNEATVNSKNKNSRKLNPYALWEMADWKDSGLPYAPGYEPTTAPAAPTSLASQLAGQEISNNQAKAVLEDA